MLLPLRKGIFYSGATDFSQGLLEGLFQHNRSKTVLRLMPVRLGQKSDRRIEFGAPLLRQFSVGKEQYKNTPNCCA